MKLIGNIIQLIPTSRIAVFEHDGELEYNPIDAIWLDDRGEMGFLMLDVDGFPETSPEEAVNFVRYDFPENERPDGQPVQNIIYLAEKLIPNSTFTPESPYGQLKAAIDEWRRLQQ